MTPPVLSGSFRRQIVVLTACVTAFAMVVLTVLVQLVLASQTKRDVDRVLEDRADAVAGSTTSPSPSGPLSVPDADLDRGVVVYAADGTLVAGIVPPGLTEAYADLSTSTTARFRNVGDDRRVLALPFTTSSGGSGVVVVDEVLTPYEEAEFYALIVSLGTGLIATAAAALLAAWVIRRALQPVSVLASTAAAWSEHDLSCRFALGPPTNELTALAGTLDALLDRVTAAIRSEQRLTSELAHELRTPLTTIQGSADLALMRNDLGPTAREDLEEISAAAHRMTSTIATLLGWPAANGTSRSPPCRPWPTWSARSSGPPPATSPSSSRSATYTSASRMPLLSGRWRRSSRTRFGSPPRVCGYGSHRPPPRQWRWSSKMTGLASKAIPKRSSWRARPVVAAREPASACRWRVASRARTAATWC